MLKNLCNLGFQNIQSVVLELVVFVIYCLDYESKNEMGARHMAHTAELRNWNKFWSETARIILKLMVEK
jgi:hypothetical protein